MRFGARFVGSFPGIIGRTIAAIPSKGLLQKKRRLKRPTGQTFHTVTKCPTIDGAGAKMSDRSDVSLFNVFFLQQAPGRYILQVATSKKTVTK